MTVSSFTGENSSPLDIYHRQLNCSRESIDLDFWKKPQGVSVPDDELNFLLIPDAVESAACLDLARQVHRWQSEQEDAAEQITRALMVTMGGLLPSVLLYDHLVEGRLDGTPTIEFGTLGVSLYKGPGQRYESPKVQHGISIPISGQTVLLLDDMGDGGGTLQFLNQYILDSGARRVLTLAMYMKPKARTVCDADFSFGETPQDTWIITPRERIETLVKRVPVWKQRGASIEECRRRLIDLIGYTKSEVDYYLGQAYNRS
ncbi:MAG: hypothetical protein F4X92_09850 [Gammaproteobacteria bacterium]|nr:hypothetical protein [Gammaproteobacteria bacterium]